MALQSQLVSIDFTGGIDSKTHPFLVIPGKLNDLRNGHWVAHNTLSKRPGSAPMSDAVAGGTTLDALSGHGFAIDTLGNELLALAGRGLYSYSSANTNWYLRGGALDATGATLTKKSVARNNLSADGHDAATTGGLTLYAWRELLGGSFSKLRCSLLDESTGTIFLASANVSDASGEALRCVSCNGKLLLFYKAAGGLLRVVIFTAAVTSLPASVTVASDIVNVASVSAIDAVADGTTDVVVAYPVTGSNVKLARVSTAGAITASVSFAGVATNTIGVGLDSSRRIFVVFYDGSTNTKFRVYDSALSSVLGATTIAAGAQSRVTLANNGATVQIYSGTVVHGGSGGVNVTTVTSAGISVAYAALLKHGGVGGRAVYLSGQSRYLLPVLFDDGDGNVPSQTFLALVDGSTGDVVARALVNGANNSIYGSVPATLALSGSSIAIPALERGRFAAAEDVGSSALTDNTINGLSRIDVSFTDIGTMQRANIGDGLVVAGAVPLFYDGVSLTELGFTMFPGILTAVLSSGSLTGVYQWVAVFEWQDAYGHRHLSAPSEPLTQTLATQQGTITIPTSSLTRRTGARAFAIHLYRTEASGTIFYKSTTYQTFAVNDAAVATVDILDNMADADLIQNEILYTSGGALESAPAPACKTVHFHKRRLFMAGLENPFEIRFTPVIGGLDAPLFNENLALFVPPVDPGGVTCQATLDDKLVIFTANKIYVSLGDGPDATGGGSSFSDPQDILSDVGCSDWRTVATTSMGIIFKSAKGFYLLTRSLQLEYIGADVEAFNGYEFTRATVLPSVNQVRFLCSQDGSDIDTGVALVYDYFYKQWSIYDGPYFGVDATVYNGTYTRIGGDGSVVLQETPNAYLENLSAYAMTAETSWLKTAGIQGFQRVRRALLVGDYQSNCTLNWWAGYDYVTSYATADKATLVGSGVYTVGSAFQVRRHLREQKCEAVRFKIFDSAQASPYQAFSLTNLTLEVAVKQGHFRGLPAAKSIG